MSNLVRITIINSFTTHSIESVTKCTRVGSNPTLLVVVSDVGY
nr:MAG TPA: hypothetical protein [Caudoviricetes sp.]